MKRFVFLALLGSIGLAHAADPFVDGDAEAGEAKAGVCVACHGVAGKSTNPQWPKLAGQSAKYIVKQLAAFKSGERSNPLMTPQAMSLSEQDMANLGAYFAAQELSPGVASEDSIELAQPIYRGGDGERGLPACAACHSPTGAGNPGAGFPHIGGQQGEYTAASLRAYRSGERGAGTQGLIMQSVAEKLTDAEIDALASYIAGLQ
ncbi:c-type cytochrome [Algiphilus sp. W345]|uniref:C-type cytochrome n=1 Tax=Banduia mediterranea TaxID=3075609 RepID=A0ABU2WGV3_9GAMM|nr:c-type cytochrome [Algiphilus sp. W345]MDT0497100.1 c-type cytochrome [Algiphilus sp. W345]